MLLLQKLTSPLLVALVALVLAACGETEKLDAGNSPAATESKPPEDEYSKTVESFTGGHTKAVWARYVGGGSDVFGNYEKLQLWGVDTRDGLGVRAILEETSNYARPMVLPDGSGIVFSNKNTEKTNSGGKKFSPVIWRVDWDGQNLTELAKGYAVEIWRDPATGTDWVYTTDLADTDRSAMRGPKLERFPIDDPTKRELVWDKTFVTTDNIQLSRDGLRASCLFPWPDAGVLNIEASSHKKYQHGCWPSMAPDSSYHAWVFDGAHKNFFMFTDNAAENWTVPVNTAPGVGKHEMYHPRWSNHVRYFTITGPYSGSTVTRSDSTEVEVYVGKFSEDLKTVEDWFQLTNDENGDLFPDLWIAEGDEVSVASSSSKAAPATGETKADWPVGEGEFLFVWENRNADNLAAGNRECSVEAREKARFGPHGEMLTDGGYFEMDDASAKAIAAQAGSAFSIELVARPDSAEGTGSIFESPTVSIVQNGSDWIYTTDEAAGSLGTAVAGKTDHLALVFDGAEFQAYQNGEPVTGEPKNSASQLQARGGNTATRLGAEWNGSLEGIVVSASAATPEQVTASQAHWEKTLAERKPIPTVKVRAKLLEMTEARPPEALDTYTRGLLGYRYEIEEVIEGELDAESVMVIHWTILDRTPLPGFPREIGKSYELVLQPVSAHPELVSERQWNDLFDPAEPWFDITSP